MSRLDTIIKENRILKQELERLLALAKENENKHKGFQLVENAFLMSASMQDLEKALGYLEEIFEVRAAIFVDELYFDDLPEKHPHPGLFFIPSKTLRYAYIDKRPYFGSYMQGLISEFQLVGAIGSYLIAPVLENGEIVASLNLYSPSPSRFSADAHDGFIRELALRVGIALKNLQNIATITRQTEHDFTTGIYNKMKMHSLLARALEACRTQVLPFGFILYDVDNFKRYNDIYGHVVGDGVLKSVADILRQELMEGGAVGRFGGDEFYVILENADAEAVRRFHNRVAKTLEKNCGVLGDAVKLSGGYALVPEDIDLTKEDAIEIVKKADSGLYHSKSAGKGEISRA